jgi:hypothetical protein
MIKEPYPFAGEFLKVWSCGVFSDLDALELYTLHWIASAHLVTRDR